MLHGQGAGLIFCRIHSAIFMITFHGPTWHIRALNYLKKQHTAFFEAQKPFRRITISFKYLSYNSVCLSAKFDIYTLFFVFQKFPLLFPPCKSFFRYKKSLKFFSAILSLLTKAISLFYPWLQSNAFSAICSAPSTNLILTRFHNYSNAWYFHLTRIAAQELISANCHRFCGCLL